VYSVHGYGRMIADAGRFEAYAAALRAAITPGCAVADIGAGTGIFALLACRFGAGRVYAIEPAPAIEAARLLATANGLSDGITFLQDLSTRVTLTEPADVIVSDLRGVLPLFQNHVPSIVDARRRLLAPRGVLIPQRDTLWAAVVEAPETYAGVLTGYGPDIDGLDMRAARRIVTSCWTKARFRPDQLLTEPARWGELDYRTVETPSVAADLEWTAARPGTAHGLCLWFDATLADGICFSNAPCAAEHIYGSAFFPLASPAPVEAGDSIECSIRADLVHDDYVWSWHTRVRSAGCAGSPRAEFRQSTLQAALVPLGSLRKGADVHVPSIGAAGRIDAFILQRMCAAAPGSLGEIAHAAAERFPERFRDWKQAMGRVGELSRQYSE